MRDTPSERGRVRLCRTVSRTGALLVLSVGFVLAGCQSTATTDPAELAAAQALPEVQRLREGDTIRVVFPGAPNLDTSQQIRRDGRVSFFIIGEMPVVGMTPAELEQELLRRYEGQIASREVSVTVVSSNFGVLVSGAVRSPGKINSERPLTVLEAVMEAGGFDDENAKTTAVVVMRNEDGRIKRFTLDLQEVLDGKNDQPFYLRPGDIIYVPKKFNWF